MTAILLTPRQGHTHDQNDISVEVDLDLLAPVFASVLCFEITPSPFSTLYSLGGGLCSAPTKGPCICSTSMRGGPQICLFLTSLFNNFFYTLGYNLILYFLLIKFQLWSLGALPVGLCISLNSLFIVGFVFCFEHFLTV